MAIRKTSSTSGVHQNEVENDLHNIRQTTFWIKKTVGTTGV